MEIILIKLLALSSLATGPKIRVPTGSLLLFTNTAEFSSNRIEVPSCLWILCTVLTITALALSPFLTLELAKSFFNRNHNNIPYPGLFAGENHLTL